MGFGNALAYGLANGASGFAQMFTRAMEMADAHKRRMEELGMRRGPQLPPGVTGETDRDMRDENKSLGREFGAAVGAPKGVTPDVKYGALPPDEAAVLQQKRVGVVPDARGGRAFSTGFAEPSGVATPATLDRFRTLNNANDKIAVIDPTANTPTIASFGETMGQFGFGEGMKEREALYPRARLDADIAGSSFGRSMSDAANQAALVRFKERGVSPAKAVEKAPQESRGPLLDKLSELDPAAQAEVAGRIGAALNHFGQKARSEKAADERTRATMKADIGVGAAKTKATDKAEIDRQSRIAEAATQAAAKLRDAGKDVTPEAVAALAGISPEEAASAIAKPRPVVQKSGELPGQRREKVALDVTRRNTQKRIDTALASAKGRRPTAVELNQVAEALNEQFESGLRKQRPTADEAGKMFGLQPGEAARIAKPTKKQ